MEENEMKAVDEVQEEIKAEESPEAENEVSEEEILKQNKKKEKEIYRSELAKRQMIVKQAGLPVIVIFEGWGASGKGSAISSIIKYMDPKFYRVYNMDVKTDEDMRKPFLWRHAVKMPLKGNFSIFDGGMMDEVTKDYLRERIDKKEYEARLKTIKNYERSLADNGYLVIKFFFTIDQKSQKERFDKLTSKKSTQFRVSKEDLWQNKHYEKFNRIYQKYLAETETPLIPWHTINMKDKGDVERDIANIIIKSIDEALANPHVPEILPDPHELIPFDGLASVDLSGKELTDEEYDEKIKPLQKELSKLHSELYQAKIPVIVAYEGWDAAGKGGNIKRLASALDPRGFEVFPIASPTPDEKGRHFLWRFYTRLPKTGHFAIYDRAWYGRVMVERLEGFCSENDWKRAYNEMNEFEEDLTNWGAVVIKFWVHIDKDTQLARFTERQNTPEKQWKITDEDWRNREKWDAYEVAVDEMIKKTNTVYAPWHILESNDKKYARVKALETVIAECKKALAKKKKNKK